MASARLEGRNGAIWQDYVQGMTQEAIAEKFNLAQSRVSQILAEVRASIPERDLDQHRNNLIESMETMRAHFAKVVKDTPPPAFNQSGRILVDENGDVVRDLSGQAQAAKLVLEISTRQAVLLGLNAPTKADITITEAARSAARAAAAEASTYLHGCTDEGGDPE